MRRGERIPIHDHSGFDAGGLVAQSTIVTLVNGGGSSGSGSVAPPVAADVPIADAGGYFAATNVEGALAEIGASTTSLDDLSDVDTTGKADADVLTWDDGTSSWVAAPAATGFTNPMTTEDDLIVGGTAGAAARLSKGSDGDVLTVDATTHHVAWKAATGGSAVTVKDEGTNLTTAVASIDFVGSGVVATTSGNNVTVTVSGGSSSSLESAAAAVYACNTFL